MRERGSFCRLRNLNGSWDPILEASADEELAPIGANGTPAAARTKIGRRLSARLSEQVAKVAKRFDKALIIYFFEPQSGDTARAAAHQAELHL